MLILAGLGLLLASIFADSLGISGGGEGVGWKQLIAAIGGAIVLLLGLGWLLRPSSAIKESRSPDEIASTR